MKASSERFWAKVDKSGDCWLWTAGHGSYGYGYLRIDGKQTSTHRISWELAYGPIPDGMHVLHDCDVPACVRPDHLFLGTQTDNMIDMVNKGRQQMGETNGHAKLCELDVWLIRNLDVPQQRVADFFDITQPTVSRIRNQKRWRHI